MEHFAFKIILPFSGNEAFRPIIVSALVKIKTYFLNSKGFPRSSRPDFEISENETNPDASSIAHPSTTARTSPFWYSAFSSLVTTKECFGARLSAIRLGLMVFATSTSRRQIFVIPQMVGTAITRVRTILTRTWVSVYDMAILSLPNTEVSSGAKTP